MTDITLKQILIRVKDVPEAAEEYSDLMEASIFYSDGARYAALVNQPISLAFVTEVETDYPVTLAYRVTDLARVCDGLVDRGYTVNEAPRDMGHELRARLMDPYGVPVNLYQPKEA